MRIVTLVENTEGFPGCSTEHGLSFYIETARHKLLFDAGASPAVVRNAELLGVNLSTVDTVVLSHGHSDHGGGLPAFMEINQTAQIWMQPSALAPHYSASGAVPRSISVPDALLELAKVRGGRLHFAREQVKIDEELSLFSGIGTAHPLPPTNGHLMMLQEGRLVRDDFRHEQCLAILQDGKYYLFSGCAHYGILNVLERFRELYDADPAAVFGGFHLMRHGVPYTGEDEAYARETAQALLAYPAQFCTCHCTGDEPYGWMKDVMGDRLSYLHCGDTAVYD